ncbi:MAG: hypothetical protein OXO51_15530 [Gemmatimonadota bacterium]|nr:hypothetical protein [Gemmatimonadota bacterium]
MTDKQVEKICDAILAGFSMLSDRIAGGTNPENVAMCIFRTNEGMNAIADSLSSVADAINSHLPNDDGGDPS